MGEADPGEGESPLKFTDVSLAKTFGAVLVALICGAFVGYIIGGWQVPEPALASDTSALGLKTQGYLNDNFFSGQGLEARITAVDPFNEDLYLVSFDVLEAGVVQQPGEVYVTKDGTAMIIAEKGYNLFLLDELLPEPEEPEPPPDEPVELKCEDIEKQEAPLLEAFVVSYCPYGLQMQRILAELVPVLGKGNIKLRYIGDVVDGKVTAMHGEPEATENHRQICIREEQPGRFWAYLSCFMKEGKADDCLKEVGVDEAELDACMADPERGLAYAGEDFALSDGFSISGSPTIILNGTRTNEILFAQSLDSAADGRSAENLKELLCCAFDQKPEACSTALSTARAATGFSESYSGSGGTGSC